MSKPDPEFFETVIIGGGQAGLTAGYYLSKQNRPFVILDANERIGDAWRKRWDSLRLFTPAVLQLPARRCGSRAPSWAYVTKDELADYLEELRRPLRASRAHRRQRRRARQGRRPVRRLGGRAPLRGGQRRRRHRGASDPEGSGLRARARSEDPAAALVRVQEPGAAARGRRAPGRSGQLGRRDRRRPLLDAPLLGGRPEGRRDPRPTRHVSCSARLSRLPVRGPPRSAQGHADRPEAGAEAPREGRPA